MTRSLIYIVPIEPVSPSQLFGPLSRTLAQVFRAETRIHRMEIDLARAFDTARNQYNSSSILLQLIDRPPGDARRILGVIDADLFVPILTFLFGEAQFEGLGAVVSTFRLHNEFYGLPPDPHLLQERLLKEAVHELGHTYGLVHCTTTRCVMNASTYVEDIDTKSPQLCERCRVSVERNRDR